MAPLTVLQWKAVKHAADEYERYATQIERVRKDIELVKQGTKKITEISSDENRVKARINREIAMAQGSDNPGRVARERVIINPDFQEACLLNRLVDFARTVGRVVISDGGLGTGWMIGEDLMITNHHVLPNLEVARGSFVNMGYERTVAGEPLNGETFRLRPDIFFMTPKETLDGDLREDELDFTIVGVESKSMGGKPLSDYGYVVLDEKLGKAIEGENCLVIQHPAGDYKKVVLRDIRLLAYEDLPGADKHLYYESDTLQGSSGSIVVALGTGEIIALHNSSVPRRDAHGRYLKKDGNPWQEGDSDSLIDWVANQGVRVSKIVEALRTSPPLSPEMEQKRVRLLSTIEERPKSVITGKVNQERPRAISREEAERTESITAAPPALTADTQRFLVKVTTLPLVREHVVSTLLQQFAGIKIQPLAPNQGDTLLGAYLKVDIPEVADPWGTARKLEAVDGLEEADPDLPRYTTVGGPEDPASGTAPVTAVPTFKESSRGKGRSSEADWMSSPYIKGHDRHSQGGLAQIRRWSHKAVNFSEDEVIKALGKKGLQELSMLRLAQFDTGYTSHSKVGEGFNLKLDYDAIEGDDDAMDEFSSGILRHYGHGTRTGSILIGVSDSLVDPAKEGNVGLLRAIAEKDGVSLSLTPFRVARSVILISRISELVDAATHAIDSGYHVMTMSMGVLPGSAALFDLARTAYERGVIWCCAAGNQVGIVVAPGIYPGVICVAASNPDNAPWTGSCRGPEVDITAPGEFIYVPTFQDGQEDMTFGNGTSYATPHVAAAAMLWLAKSNREIGTKYAQPWQRVEAFRYCLQHSARQESKLPRGKFGAGILDVDKLLKTPLPDASKLHHAYLGAAGLEKATGKRPLAVREMEYKDWQVVLSESLPSDGQGKTNLKERQGAMRSPSSQDFARLLEAQSGLRRKVETLESTTPPATSPSAAYNRLLVLHELQSQPKPIYEP
ncbi:S8 family serine peptidase [Pontibacter toksunensis]|uniref:Serine protease n=1 Tax=Pontibacter toksunensis TaxID=1332631 RepID=A0ABW6C1R6_9BACT